MKNKEWQQQKKISPGPIILIILLLGVMVFSGYRALKEGYLYKAGSDRYREVSEGVVTVETSLEPTVQPSRSATSESQKPSEKEKAPISVDFKLLQEQNPDVFAWIYLPGTNVNYPVVQGEDNDYYLTHLVDGTENVDGTIFADYRAKPFALQNTILYGHHMFDGNMFQNLMEYKEQQYYDLHPVIYLLTPKQNYRINLLWGAVVPSNDLFYYNTVMDREDLADDLERIAEKSTFQSQTEYHKGDKLITLSTCSYEYDGARFLVIGQLEEIG